MALTNYEAIDIVANSRKNPLEAWQRLQKRYDPTTGGRKRNLLRTIISPGRCSLLELQAAIERWESYVSRHEKTMKDWLDDEIKLAGLESLVPEELEKHLILNSNRLRTFEDASLELVAYVEAKFGFRVRDSKPSDTGAGGHSDPMDVDAVNSLLSGKGKGSSSPRDGCFKCGGAHFQRDCNARKNAGKQSSGKCKQSRSWSKSEGKGKTKENQGNPKENPREPKVPKACTRAKHRKLVSLVWKTRNGRQVQKLRNRDMSVPLTFPGTMAGRVTNGTMAGVLLVGTKVGHKRMTLPQAHFHLEVWMSVPPVVGSGLNGRK